MTTEIVYAVLMTARNDTTRRLYKTTVLMTFPDRGTADRFAERCRAKMGDSFADRLKMLAACVTFDVCETVHVGGFEDADGDAVRDDVLDAVVRRGIALGGVEA